MTRGATAFYSPDIKAFVATEGRGIVDVSKDIEDFQLQRNVSAESVFQCTLNNKQFKYDGVIGRMDRIAVYLKKKNWLQEFAGYVSLAPFKQVVPGPTRIRALCTLKRLEHTYWDPGTPEAQAILPNGGAAGTQMGQTGGGDAAGSLYNLLTKVVGWNGGQINIQKIPQAWLEQAVALGQDVEKEVDQSAVVALDNLMNGSGLLGNNQVTIPGVYQTAAGNTTPYGGPTSGVLGIPDLISLAKSVGFNGDGLVKAVAIAMAESGGNPIATNTAGNSAGTDRGIWQINDYYHKDMFAPGQPLSGDGWKDPVANARAAYIISSAGTSWGAWSTYNGTAYNGYLPQVTQAVQASVGPGQTPVGMPGTPPAAPTGGQTSVPIPYASGTPTNVQPGVGGALQSLSDASAGLGITGKWVVGYTLNHSATTASGNPSLHASGMAADIDSVPPSDPGTLDKIFKYFSQFASQIAELICHTPNEPYSIKNGQQVPPIADNPGHVHIGVTAPTFNGVAGGVAGSPGGGAMGAPATITIPSLYSPFNIMYRTPTPSLESQLYTGNRAFINDEKVLLTVQWLTKAALREFQSAPNGDFIAWYPDRFGLYGQAPVLQIHNIELTNFDITISDDSLVTHVGVAGDTPEGEAPDAGGLPTGTISPYSWLVSAGIVTVQNPKILNLMMKLDPGLQYVGLSGDQFLNKFGLRPHIQEVPEIRDHLWEFMLGFFVFMQQWAGQFNTNVTFTFMPEIYPGMRVEFPEHDLRMYVESVTHTGSRTQGFSTSAVLSCPTDLNDRLYNVGLEQFPNVPTHPGIQ